MIEKTPYLAKPVDINGIAQYSEEENQIWHELYSRQLPILKGHASDEFIHGLTRLNLSPHCIPQCPDVSAILRETTGWSLAPVPALIPFKQFFDLLANKQFPAATFIRRREELDYVQEPDIFHEIFGHGPMLTNPAVSAFTHAYGKLGKTASHKEQVMLAKLYWFTIEFGLINTSQGLRAYGGGILSSPNETRYCLQSQIPQRKPFEVMEVLRTPYRIDHIQPIYFVIEDYEILFDLIKLDLIKLIHQALELGPITTLGEN